MCDWLEYLNLYNTRNFKYTNSQQGSLILDIHLKLYLKLPYLKLQLEAIEEFLLVEL